MNNRAPQYQEMVDYLLGRMPPDEAAAMELRYLRDAALLEALGAVEDELVDDYLEEELTASERESFERRYLATEAGRKKIQFSRALVKSSGGGDRRGWRWLAVAAALVVATAGGLLYRPAALRVPTPVVVAVPKPAPAPVIRTFVLVPHLVRGGGDGQQVVIEASVTEVRLQLQMDNPDASRQYRAALRSVDEDKTIWTRAATGTEAGAELRVASEDLPAGDYILSLQAPGLETVASYAVRVVRR